MKKYFEVFVYMYNIFFFKLRSTKTVETIYGHPIFGTYAVISNNNNNDVSQCEIVSGSCLKFTDNKIIIND